MAIEDINKISQKIDSILGSLEIPITRSFDKWNRYESIQEALCDSIINYLKLLFLRKVDPNINFLLLDKDYICSNNLEFFNYFENLFVSNLSSQLIDEVFKEENVNNFKNLVLTTIMIGNNSD